MDEDMDVNTGEDIVSVVHQRGGWCVHDPGAAGRWTCHRASDSLRAGK